MLLVFSRGSWLVVVVVGPFVGGVGGGVGVVVVVVVLVVVVVVVFSLRVGGGGGAGAGRVDVAAAAGQGGVDCSSSSDICLWVGLLAVAAVPLTAALVMRSAWQQC